MFTESDAQNAIIRIAKLKGNTRGALIERMFRLETEHFKSGQYKKTGSAGMEKGKWSKVGMPANLTYVKMKDNHDGRMVDFIVWPSVYDFCVYLSNYIDRYGGNWARWNSMNSKAQNDYKIKVKSVKNRWIVQNIDGEFDIKDDSYFEGSKRNKMKEIWGVSVGENIISEEIYEEPSPEYETFETNLVGVDEKKAKGIWQIIKLVSDQYSLSQNINDATIAFNQGSLLNYVHKVVQSPWLQFFGDTVGDQYYFQSRKEPFDRLGYKSLPLIKSIQNNEVLDQDLDWYNGDVFSWYQLIPKGSFLGQQNLIFAYIKSVFFQEFAEIWGSKPNIQVSNYVNFNKLDQKDKMFEKAVSDLRYMVESSAYLPFTRNGVIVIDGDSSIRRGYKIFYEPTGEFYYIDSVSQNYSVSENGPNHTTTLKVSRGIVKNFFESYFDLIDYDNGEPQTQKILRRTKDSELKFYFDKSKPNLINLEEDSENSKILNDLNNSNEMNLSYVADYIQRHKGQKFTITVNEESGDSLDLPERRGKTLRELIINKYLESHNELSKSELTSNIDIKSNNESDNKIKNNLNNIGDNPKSDKDLIFKRSASFQLVEYDKYEDVKIYQNDISWRVNKDVFNMFLNRRQFTNGR